MSFLICMGTLSACSQPVIGPDASGIQSSAVYQGTKQDPKPPQIVNQWYAEVNGNTSPDVIAAELGLTVLSQDPDSKLVLFLGEITKSELEDHEAVELADPNNTTNWSVPVDLTLGFSQGGWTSEDVENQFPLQALHLDAVHERKRGTSVRIAVLDTGVDPTHPHLKDRVDLLGPGELLTSVDIADGIDNDQNGEADDAYGHGTHVSGTILSLAPDVTIIPIRVLNEEGWGTEFDLATGLEIALEQDVDLVNLSLVLTDVSPIIAALLDELAAEGIKVIGAGGNEPGLIRFPASHHSVLGIAAVDAGIFLAPFSGSIGAKFAAPGVDILNAYPGGALAYGTGTSMS
ncbi:MAG: S8 family serine peptidase, partial [Candidatus Eisenbacteria bacterium]|nr:S8 family serine peptidase [Candidatus Eisenbacteria bacterium]